MKSLAMKFTAIVLAAVFLLTGVASVLGMVFAAILDEEQQTPDEMYYEELRNEALQLAYAKTREYQIYQHSTAPREVVEHAMRMGFLNVYNIPSPYALQVVGWVITDQTGQSASEGDMTPGTGRQGFYFESLGPSYEIVVPSADVRGPQKETFGYSGISYSILRREGTSHSVEIMLEIADMPGVWDLLFFVYAISDMLPLILIAACCCLALAWCIFAGQPARKRVSTAYILQASMPCPWIFTRLRWDSWALRGYMYGPGLATPWKTASIPGCWCG